MMKMKMNLKKKFQILIPKIQKCSEKLLKMNLVQRSLLPKKLLKKALNKQEGKNYNLMMIQMMIWILKKNLKNLI